MHTERHVFKWSDALLSTVKMSWENTSYPLINEGANMQMNEATSVTQGIMEPQTEQNRSTHFDIIYSSSGRMLNQKRLYRPLPCPLN